MKIPETTRFADKQLQTFADQTRGALMELDRAPYLDGHTIEVPARGSAGAFIVTHGLRRVPRGWLVLYVQRPSGSNTDWSLYHRTSDQWDNGALALYATGSFDLLRVWVF